MADEQKKYPYPTNEFLQELTDQITQWAYDTFALKSETEVNTYASEVMSNENN